MNERESIQLNLADFVVAVERVLDGCLSMPPAAAYFFRRQPTRIGSGDQVSEPATAICGAEHRGNLNMTGTAPNGKPRNTMISSSQGDLVPGRP
jgi:hypothetical protein